MSRTHSLYLMKNKIMNEYECQNNNERKMPRGRPITQKTTSWHVQQAGHSAELNMKERNRAA